MDDDKKELDSVTSKFADTKSDEPEKQETVNETDLNNEPSIAEVEFSKNDPETDKIVDEIVNAESDELLEARDDAVRRQFTPAEEKGFKAKIKRIVSTWWNNKKLRYGSLIGLVVALILAMFIPYSRYGLLNLFGVRVSSSITITDSGTGLPLKNISVNLQGQEQKSDEEGNVKFYHLKQGHSQLVIDKRGYAKYEKTVTLGWGSNPLGELQIVATGSRYSFILQDWLGENIIKNGTASSGEDVAKTDDNGKIILTISEINDQADVTVSADGYRDEKFNINDLQTDSDNTVLLVPSKKHVFVSNRDGKYDLYKIDVDGKNEELLLAGTGKEREVPQVVVNQDYDTVTFISSRDGYTDKDKYVLDGLFTIDVNSGEVYNITRSEQIQIIGWSGKKLVFVSVIEGVSAGNSQRSKITSFDLDSRERTEIAAANYFNDVELVNDTIFYAVSSYAVPKSQAKVFSAKVDGTSKKTIIDEQAWNIVRKDVNSVLFDTESGQWYELTIGGEANKIDKQSAYPVSRSYVPSPDQNNFAWIDNRDGKSVMLIHAKDTDSDKDEIINTLPGMGYPVYWINNDTIVYRVSTSNETADYVISTSTSHATKKITDVKANYYNYFYP